MGMITIRRKRKTIDRRYRETKMFAKAMYSPHHPVVAQIVPIRRCNLACTYCNEFDDHSKPVPAGEMLGRVDKLAELGTTIITISGGEPLLHPDLDQIISRIRSHGALATLITNGYLLVPDRIKRLNEAGLDYLQLSIDNVNPDGVSKKSLKVLDKKLKWLAEHAEFSVTINSVLGSSIDNPEDAEQIAGRARELGFTSTVGVIHDHDGQLKPLDDHRRSIYEGVLRMGTPLFSFAQYDRFQKNVTKGLPNDWHCRAGARYIYICEDGLVHRCSQQRGTPGTPLAEYSVVDLEREANTPKGCAPYCTVSCVHQTAMLDAFRETPRETLHHMMNSRKELDPSFRIPMLVKALDWMFLREENKKFFEKLAIKVLGLKRPELKPAVAPATASFSASSVAPDVPLEQLLQPSVEPRRSPRTSRLEPGSTA
jgi:MoaA/NifB/PqqE/SkfB family radical SAM enzyme